jgi:DNA-directed RNA polymerase specialized sigma24 family protein
LTEFLEFFLARRTDSERVVDESDSPAGPSKPSRTEPIAPTDELAGSVTRWLGGLKAGDERALEPLWDRYYATLVERARAKLAALRSSTAVNDEEDLALSVFQSLYDGVRAGRFPRLDDRDDLWRLLVHLTACKAIDRHRAESRQKRGGGNVFNEADIFGGRPGEGEDGNPLDRIIGTEPSAEFATMVAEEYIRRLDSLGDASLRTIAELKLACYTNDEIRERLGCSLRTVTLKLELIRKKWQLSMDPS